MKNKSREKEFPVFWTVVLIISLIWFSKELGYLTLNIPWFPLILVIISLFKIINYSKKNG